MGCVKDKCILHKNRGDQYVEWCASCLNMLTKEYAVLPPYFDFSILNADEKTKKEKETVF